MQEMSLWQYGHDNQDNENYFQGTDYQLTGRGSDKTLAPNWRQSIIWFSDGLVQCRMCMYYSASMS